MKLKSFTPENTHSQRKGTPSIHLNGKTGLIAISKCAAEKLNLKKGELLCFHQDEEEEQDWYIEKVKEGGFYFREYKSGFMVNSTALVRKIFESVVFERESGRILLAGQPTKLGARTMHGLLVNCLKN
jgi:hypothetical protein